LIDTDLADPAYTAAVDEALLVGAIKGGAATLHFYRRRPPGVTLGYFLKASENADLSFCTKKGIKVIRRLSGGGAIYTDEGQLVYGLVVRDLLPAAPLKCFEIVCGALVKALGALGCEAVYSPVNDVLVNGKKLSGSALVNRGRIKLAHGTLIVQLDRDTMFKALRTDTAKLKAKGLEHPGERVTSVEEVLGKKPPMADVKVAVAKALAEEFDLKVKTGSLTAAERIHIDELVRTKYGTDEWNLKD
jgi:lipoate---protein ligase